jgi:hypothetical protein
MYNDQLNFTSIAFISPITNDDAGKLAAFQALV